MIIISVATTVEEASTIDLKKSPKKKKKRREEKESVAFVPRGMIERRVYIVFARGRSVADVYLATDATKANNENMCWMQEASLANLFLSARPIVRDLTLPAAIRQSLVVAFDARFFASPYCRRVLVTGSKHEFLIAEMGPR